MFQNIAQQFWPKNGNACFWGVGGKGEGGLHTAYPQLGQGRKLSVETYLSGEFFDVCHLSHQFLVVHYWGGGWCHEHSKANKLSTNHWNCMAKLWPNDWTIRLNYNQMTELFGWTMTKWLNYSVELWPNDWTMIKSLKLFGQTKNSWTNSLDITLNQYKLI